MKVLKDLKRIKESCDDCGIEFNYSINFTHDKVNIQINTQMKSIGLTVLNDDDVFNSIDNAITLVLKEHHIHSIPKDPEFEYKQELFKLHANSLFDEKGYKFPEVLTSDCLKLIGDNDIAGALDILTTHDADAELISLAVGYHNSFTG